MNIARKIFNNQHTTTEIIDLFRKRYYIDKKDPTFCWLCLNEVEDYYIFLRDCQLAGKWSVVKNESGFDITIDNEENAVLVNGIKKWVLHRRMRQPACNSIDKITTYRIHKF